MRMKKGKETRAPLESLPSTVVVRQRKIGACARAWTQTVKRADPRLQRSSSKARRIIKALIFSWLTILVVVSSLGRSLALCFFGCSSRQHMMDKKPTSIFLIGMMASGKSTVGRRLAERLGWAFYDGQKRLMSVIKRRAAVCRSPISLKKKERRDFELGKRRCWLS